MKKSSPIISSRNLSIPLGQISYTLRQSPKNRRTITITVNEHSEVLVSAPTFTALDTIEGFIHKKAKWILHKMEDHKNKKTVLEKKRYVNGSQFLFLGNTYGFFVKEEDVKKPLIHLSEKGWDVWVSSKTTEKHIKEELENWYRAQAEDVLTKRAVFWMEKLEVKDCEVNIRTQKRIWGSCHHRKRKVFLNWHMVMAPMDVIDYIIVHELSHLWVANHSRRFWKKVRSILPDYKLSVKWLKEHATDMILP